MSLSKTDLRILESLTIVTVDGFEPEKDLATDPDTGATFDATPIDAPGSANWLCEQYGMSGDELTEPGILWTDYDDSGWKFSVLIDSEEVERFKAFASEAGYEIVKTTTVDEPESFGDGNGTVDILKHRNGWVLLS